MLMTKSAYARHNDVSRQTVYDWIAKGELVLVDGKMDMNATKAHQNNQTDKPRTLELTWLEAYQRVKASARELSVSDTEIRLCVEQAAGEVGYDVEYEGDDITLMCDGVELRFTYSFLSDNAWLAIRYLRNNYREASEEGPDL